MLEFCYKKIATKLQKKDQKVDKCDRRPKIWTTCNKFVSKLTIYADLYQINAVI